MLTEAVKVEAAASGPPRRSWLRGVTVVGAVLLATVTLSTNAYATSNVTTHIDQRAPNGANISSLGSDESDGACTMFHGSGTFVRFDRRPPMALCW